MPDQLDQQLLDVTPDALLVAVDDRVAFANRAAAELFAAPSPAALIGLHATSFVPEADRPSMAAGLAQLTRGEVADRTVEVPVVRLDGSVVHAEVRLIAIRFAGGPALMVVARDISARLEQERVAAAVHELSVRLAAADEGGLDREVLRTLGRLGSLADVDRVYLIRFSTDGQFFTTTHEWCAPGVASHADHIARVAAGQFPHSTRFLRENTTFAVSDVSTLGPPAAAERESFTRYGVKAVLQVPMNVGGRLVGLVGFNDMRRTREWDRSVVDLLVGVCDVLGHTLTRTEALAEARLARAEAERWGAESRRFLARVSHELRTPLHAILGFGELLQLEASPAQAVLVRHILDAGGQLQDMVNAVLDLTVLDDTPAAPVLTPVPVAVVAGSARELLSAEAIERGVRLHVDDSCAEHLVLADHDRLLQLLRALVSNAVRYNRPGGTCTIAAHASGRHDVAITVDDDGPGIEAADLAKAFEPFERLGAEYRGIPGAGLGLTLARQLASSMGGSVELSSVRAEGTRATVELASADGADVEGSIRDRR